MYFRSSTPRVFCPRNIAIVACGQSFLSACAIRITSFSVEAKINPMVRIINSDASVPAQVADWDFVDAS